MKKLVPMLLVAMLVGHLVVESQAFGANYLGAYLNYLVYKFQKNFYANNVIKYLKGFRFYIQPIYDYGYGPWISVGSTYFNNKPGSYSNYQKPSLYRPTAPNYQTHRPYSVPNTNYQKPGSYVAPYNNNNYHTTNYKYQRPSYSNSYSYNNPTKYQQETPNEYYY